MIFDLAYNYLLFFTRVGVTLISFIIIINLLADVRRVSLTNRNGLWHTRIALVWLLLGLFVDNGLYSIGHIHSQFRTIEFAMWVQKLLFLFILTKMVMLYGLWLLYKLFKSKDN